MTVQEMEISIGDTIQIGRHTLVVLDVIGDEIHFEISGGEGAEACIELSAPAVPPR